MDESTFVARPEMWLIDDGSSANYKCLDEME
jgi:hypothetical protein